MPPRRCLADKKGSVSTGLCSGGDDNECCDLVGYYSCGERGKGACVLLCLNLVKGGWTGGEMRLELRCVCRILQVYVGEVLWELEEWVLSVWG